MAAPGEEKHITAGTGAGDVTSTGAVLPGDDISDSSTADDNIQSTQGDKQQNQSCTMVGRVIPGGTQLLNMEEVCSQLQDSETTFVQAHSQVVADSKRSQCIQTEDLEEASDILQDTGQVILCGFPGTGKTTVGHALLRRCREEGFKPYILPQLEDWHAHIGPGRRSFVLIDGLMGVVRVDRQQYCVWSRILPNMLELIKSGDCRVVVTLYPHVLHELQQLETDSQSPLLDSSAVVRLMKEDLDTEMKRELLDFHLKQLPLQPSQQQELVERIVQADTSGPAFLWCCRYLVDHWQAVVDPATVFTSSAEAYSVLIKQMCLHETQDDSFAAVLALAMQGKGRFLHRKTGVQSELRSLGFKKYSEDHLAKYEDILHGSVLSETDRGFSSRAWYDAAGLALGRSFRLPTLLEVCDVTFLVQHVHVTVTDGTQKALKILVGSGPFASPARKNKSVTHDCFSLTQRLYIEITKGNLPEICQHTALQCPEFLLEMAEYCTKEQNSAKQLVTVVDTVHKLPLLYWSAVNKQHWCFSMLDLTDKEDLKLLSQTVLLGLSLFSNWACMTVCTTRQALFKGLLSAPSFQFSDNVQFLPRTNHAECTAGRKARFQYRMVEDESNIQQLHYQCDPSLPIPPMLVKVHVSDDTVRVQVRDRGDWYLALRLLADREVDETDRDGNTMLHIAAEKGNLEAIILAVKSGASLTKANNKGLTPYQLAQKRREVFDTAIDRGNVAIDLLSAIRNVDEVEVKALLCYGSSIHDEDAVGRTGLLVACEEGQGNIADLLIGLGADVNVRAPSSYWCPQTPLFLACRGGLTRTVELLVKKGADFNARNEYEETALHCACQCDSPKTSADITRVLLDAGAVVNAKNKYDNIPLHHASNSGHAETLRLLTDHGADLNAKDNNGRTPLHHAYTAKRPDLIITQLLEAGLKISRIHQAVVRGDVDALVTLLQQGADVNQHDTSMCCSPLHAACLMGRTDIVTCLTQHGAHVNAVDDMERTPLHHACAAGHTQVAQQFIDDGADVNVWDESQSTPLHEAAAIGNTEITLCLLEHGAEVDAADDYDITPLHTACLLGHTETVQCLLQHGANLDAASEFGTPLHSACEKGYTEIAKCLLQHGANVNAVSDRHGTPLHTACENCHTHTVLWLLQHGANVNAESKRYDTPLYRAFEKRHIEIAQLLLDYGANVTAISLLYDDQHDMVNLLVQHGAVSRDLFTRTT